MRDHPELLFWRKCACCQYSEYNVAAHTVYPKASKFARRQLYSGTEVLIRPEDTLEELFWFPTSSHTE